MNSLLHGPELDQKLFDPVNFFRKMWPNNVGLDGLVNLAEKNSFLHGTLERLPLTLLNVFIGRFFFLNVFQFEDFYLNVFKNITKILKGKKH